MRAEAAHITGIAGAGGRNHTQSRPVGELNRIGADISGGAMDKHGLAAGEMRLLEQRLPGCDDDHGHGSSIDITKPSVFLCDHTSRCYRKFGIGTGEARISYAKHRIAWLECRHF
jgi:hypothetical protein